MTSEDDDRNSDEEPGSPVEPAGDEADYPLGDRDGPNADDVAESDPFDEFSDATAGTEGDPFGQLGKRDDDEEMGPDTGGETTMPGTFEPVDEPDIASFDVEEPSESDPFSEMAPEFAEFDLGDVDEDEVWEALSAAEARGSVADIQDRTYAEVSKHSYCEQCENLTDPPETACANEDTEILSFTGMKTVRLVDCPVVAERRELERDH